MTLLKKNINWMSKAEKGRNPGSYRDRKLGRPEDSLKSKVESLGSEGKDTAPPIDGPESELNESEAENESQIEDPQRRSPLEHLEKTNNSEKSEITMEVHHHPNVEKKSFKEYLLEGLMIFLAVTMGFFAETIRENISDNSKAKEYIRSFVQDLRRDTATFSRLLAFDEKKAYALNSLDPCYDAIENSRPANCLVPIIKSSASNKNANFTDGTMQQLKNAGGFRLLNSVDKDSIVSYEYAVRSYQ